MKVSPCELQSTTLRQGSKRWHTTLLQKFQVRSERPLMALARARPLELENREEQPPRVEVEDEAKDR
jgi:hypothetical protein